jgi:hypothetical protein
MADPREDVRHVGIGYVAFPYTHDDTIVFDIEEENGSAQVGLAVTLESDAVVSLAGDGEEVEGKLVKVEPGGLAVVQVGGVMELPAGNAATVTVGTKIVGALGAASAEGYIKSASTQHTVSRGTIIDNDDLENVVVRLEAIGN